MIGVLLVALALRVAAWLLNLPLHHDEALYGAWARSIADGSDPLLLVPWVDKPPLVPYLLSGSIRAFGVSELALRVPGMVASLLTVWATYGLARRVYGARAALVAAALLALSPFAILFAPTAFTDPWLTLFLVASAWAAVAGRPGWAGALVGLAAASKQQGLFAIPLVVALILTSDSSRLRRSSGARLGSLGLALLGFAVVFGLVTYWDSLRWHNRPSYWDQSLRTYGGVTLAALGEWPQRAAVWAKQIGLLFGTWWIAAPVLTAALYGVIERRPSTAGWKPCVRSAHDADGTADRAASFDFAPPADGAPLRMLSGASSTANAPLRMPYHSPRIVAGYVLGYLLVHVAYTFQPWDRYLLPVLPLICVLAGQGVVALTNLIRETGLPRALRAVAGATAASAAIYAVSLGVNAAIPVGSDVGAYRGVAEAARFLARQPGPTTVYHDHLGWHLDYYLYGLPVTRSWFDSPQKLASEAARVAAEKPGETQWLALPAWEDAELAALQSSLGARGFEAEPEAVVMASDGRSAEVTLYRLMPARSAQLADLRDRSAAP